jgi:hypothetical protein
MFTSIFATEMKSYLELLVAAGRYIDKIKSSLKSLDCYLNAHNYKDKILTESFLSSWIASKQVKNITKSGILSDIKGFVRYLSSLGI